jgi:hypothetical protein
MALLGELLANGTSQKNFRQHFQPAPTLTSWSPGCNLFQALWHLPWVRPASFTLAKHIRPAAPTDRCKPLGVLIRHELFISGLAQRLRSSKTYADKPWVMVPAQAIVRQFLVSFKEFPNGLTRTAGKDLYCAAGEGGASYEATTCIANR